VPELHPRQYIIEPGNNRGRITGNKLLLTGSDDYIRLLEGEHFFEPVYGTASLWIEQDEENKIFEQGGLILRGEHLLISHIVKVIEKNLYVFINETYLSSCLQELAKSHPLLVKRIKEINIPGKTIVSVLRNLMSEGINIRDIVSILSEILHLWPRTDDIVK
jgi:flagellar biosynthesis protein FlhA